MMVDDGSDRDRAVRVTDGPDAGAVWHYGDPMREQRRLAAGRGRVDLGHRGVIRIAGPDRLAFLHSLTTQHLERLAPGEGTTAYVLDPQGHIEQVMYGVDDGEAFWAHTEPGHAAQLVDWLDRMRFMMRVEVTDVTTDHAVVWSADPDDDLPGLRRRGEDSLGGAEWFVPRAERAAAVAVDHPAGLWAYEAIRIEHGVPRIFVDTDARTIPNELGVPGPAVHLDKGCYRGQETVARVYNLGRPPRRLALLHLDGSVDRLPVPGAELTVDGKAVGVVGSSARHYELGPIALGLIRRAVSTDAGLQVDGIAVAQESLVDPEAGLHVRARLA